MPPQINFNIGDITTAIEWPAGQFEFNTPQAYHPFLSDDKADIRLELHAGAPQVESPIKVFDSPPIWSLYRNGDKSVIRMFGTQAGLQRFLVLPSDFGKADLYFSEPRDAFSNPFFGPTLELMMITYLTRRHGVILHACGIEYEGKGLLFAGESGAGKSTLANLWNRESGATVLSDDRTLVRDRDGELRLYGTPWHGEAKFGDPRGVKLEKIFFLHHGQTNTIQSPFKTEIVIELLKCAFPPFWDAAGMTCTLEFFESLATRISCRTLEFKPDLGAVDVVKRHILGDKVEGVR